MNADRLLAHYETIADAPDAIARLRKFVLDLAVRGKLVSQDPKDKPASDLLKRITKEKAQQGIRYAFFPISNGEVPFDLPSGWIWSCIGEICSKTGSGSTPRGGKEVYRTSGVPFLRSQNVYNDGLRLDDVAYIDGETHSRMNGTKVLPGDLLLNITGGSIGRCCRVPGDCDEANVSQHVAIIRIAVSGIEDFLHRLILSPYFQAFILGEQTGAGRGGLPKNRMDQIAVALPPLAEQHRIVAKVDELMALCDQLATARAEREATRDRLAAASLARLNAPDPDPATFAEHARFALDALPALTARADQIKQLRQTILNLAVRGKLVPQDPKDEPASELVKKIAVENRKLMTAKGIRSQKPAMPATNFEGGSDIPSAWRQVYLQDIAYQITDGTHLTPKYTESGRPFLSAQNLKPFRFMPQKHRFVSQVDFDNYRANRRPERGDILMTRVGAGIGEAAVLDSDFKFAFYVSLCLIKVPNRLVSVDYLVLWLNSPEGRDSSTIRTYGKGASQGNLNLGLIRTFKIPLPPLAEQRRIVAKVDELMALFDQLELSLVTGQDTRHRLLNALLAESLAPPVAAGREAA
jgi:type I restriction enzyme S subunit